jgi:hypothetical protein
LSPRSCPWVPASTLLCGFPPGNTSSDSPATYSAGSVTPLGEKGFEHLTAVEPPELSASRQRILEQGLGRVYQTDQALAARTPVVHHPLLISGAK